MTRHCRNLGNATRAMGVLAVRSWPGRSARGGGGAAVVGASDTAPLARAVDENLRLATWLIRDDHERIANFVRGLPSARAWWS